jgi:hypothetical protein
MQEEYHEQIMADGASTVSEIDDGEIKLERRPS